MPPWLRDSDGNDVFDGMNPIGSGEPIVDPIDLGETFGSNPVTDGLDGLDESLRNIGATSPAGVPGSYVGSVLDSMDSMGSDLRDNAQDGSGALGITSWGYVVIGLVVLAVVGLVARPYAEIAANLTDDN